MKQLGKTFTFWSAVLLLWECAFHTLVYGIPTARFLSAIPLTLGLAGLLTALSHLWGNPLANKITRFVLLTALAVVFGVQTVYFNVFGALLSLAYVGMGGEAIGNFAPMVIAGIEQSILYILLYLLPIALLALLQRRGVLDAGQVSPALCVLLASGAVLISALGVPPMGGEGRAAVYYDAQSTADRQAEYFGLLTAERLELGRLLSDATGGLSNGIDLQGGGEAERNIMPEINFEALDAAADSDAIRELNDYFASLSGTAKNDYTGFFQGFNYIQICAEAYSPYLVDPEKTPALYKLTHEGIVFDHFYNTFSSITSNGEYSLCMGLLPDLSRMSFATSVDNYVPFTLAHFFRDQEGRHPLAYHNNYATFYNRINTHTNIGYDFRAVDYGLDMEPGYPASDLEMMWKSVDDYLYNQPFAVHYMTYSGHSMYNFTDNNMSVKNEARARALWPDCENEELLAYYACQLELEDAISYLLQRLEEAGIADRTVIVLTGDHYPYGLSDESYQELAGEEAMAADPFWRYHSNFACWTGALDEPIHVSEYCCTQDILPTISNLFGLTYESRMLTGTDVFSTATHIALLQNGSFVTTDLRYDSDSGQITYFTPEEELPEGYAQQLLQATQNQFSASAAILRSDYFGFVFSTLHLAESTAPENTGRASFSDINGLWYEDSVELLVGRGALSGTDSGRYRGEEPCTREMLAIILTRVLYLETAEETPMPYGDVTEDMWCYQYVAATWAAGIFPSSEEFRPRDALTEADVRSALCAAAIFAGIENAGIWANGVIDDVLAQAHAAGESTDILTRGVAAAIVARLVEVTE